MSLWPKNFCLSFRALRRRNIYLCFTGGGGRRTLGGGGRDTCMKKITEGGACCSLETWFAFLTSRCVRNRDNGHVESYSVNECERNMLTIKNNFLFQDRLSNRVSSDLDPSTSKLGFHDTELEAC